MVFKSKMFDGHWLSISLLTAQRIDQTVTEHIQLQNELWEQCSECN
jgi:hypothetical protein